jgi:inhibitor of the pro-sigma K processing machinery
MGICFMLLLWILLKEKFIEGIARMIVGGILIYTINSLLPQYAIGINLISLGCSGVLGIPGVAMLYIVGIMV